MKLSKTGKDKIDRIPGDDGWWKLSNRKYFYDAVQELIGKGFEEDDAIDFMGAAYYAASSEFGN